ncbi:MAG: hypothetical protein ACP5NS_00555 [Candidatus Pacearchaeota archaeon]
MNRHKFVIEEIVVHEGPKQLRGYVLHSVANEGPQVEEARAFVQEIESHYIILNGLRAVGVEHEEERAYARAHGIVNKKANRLFDREKGDTLEDKTKYKTK